MLKRGEADFLENRSKALQPIIEPLKKLAERPMYKVKKEVKKEEKKIKEEGEEEEERQQIKCKDQVFGIYWDPKQDSYVMGTKKIPVNIEENKLVVAHRQFPKTAGLMTLLTQLNVKPSDVTKKDLQNYKSILQLTGAHLLRSGRLATSNTDPKYKQFIEPMFREKSGTSLPPLSMKVSNTSYSYWNDPNELVQRLSLLCRSRMAGNTGVDNEILAIEEELREAGYI